MGQDLRKEPTCIVLGRHAAADERRRKALREMQEAIREANAAERELLYRAERDGGLCLVYGDRVYVCDESDGEYTLVVHKAGLTCDHDHHLSPAGQPSDDEGGDMPSTGEAILATAAQAWGGGA